MFINCTYLVVRNWYDLICMKTMLTNMTYFGKELNSYSYCIILGMYINPVDVDTMQFREIVLCVNWYNAIVLHNYYMFVLLLHFFLNSTFFLQINVHCLKGYKKNI